MHIFNSFRENLLLISSAIPTYLFLDISMPRYGGHNTRCYHLLMAHCDGDAFCLLLQKKKARKNQTQQAAPDCGCSLSWTRTRRWRGVLLKCMIPTHEQPQQRQQQERSAEYPAKPMMMTAPAPLGPLPPPRSIFRPLSVGFLVFSFRF